MSLTTIVIYLLCFQQTLNADSSKGLMSDRQFLADLEMKCPYTSFCGGNASLPFPGNEERIPCCHDCSCDPSCGLNNNCCFKHLDVYNVEDTYQMICKSIKLNAKSFEASQHMRMVNRCFSTNVTSTDLHKSDALFDPVFAPKTGYIYYNTEVALCNKITEIVPFQKSIICSFQDDFMGDADRILHGLEPNSECHIQYQPPKGVDLESELCKPRVIRKCNVTGVMREWEPFWHFCESFNSTFVLQTGLQEYVYGNIYCYMCNEQVYKNRSSHSINTCFKSLDKFSGGGSALTVILTPGFTYENAVTEVITEPSRSCPHKKILVPSITNLCRPIKCPVWKIPVQSRCMFYSNRWIGVPFTITIRLESASSKSKISRSFFKKLSRNDRNDRKANWIKRKTMKRWELAVFYHPSIDGFSVEYLIIEAKCPFFSVNPKYIEDTVKRTLDDSWYINDKTGKITLNMHLTEGRSYVGRALAAGEEYPYFEKDYTRDYTLIRQGDDSTGNYKDEPLVYVSDGHYHQSGEVIFLTKLFFCQQVDLLPDEYEEDVSNPDMIFFKVKNVTLYDFRRVNSIVSGDIEDVKETVRVCLSEFDTSPSIGISKHSIEANVLLISTIILINVFIRDIS